MATPDSQLLIALSPVLLADSDDQYLEGTITIHAARIGAWLQYWIAYPADKDHAGHDHELIMVLLVDDHPAVAVYAQHRWCRARAWQRIQRASGHPIVYVGRGKHASYYREGWHRHGRHLERANGRRLLEAQLVLDTPPAVRRRLVARDPTTWVQQNLRGRTPPQLATAMEGT